MTIKKLTNIFKHPNNVVKYSSSLKTEVADIKGILSALDFSSLKVSSLTNILDPNRSKKNYIKLS